MCDDDESLDNLMGESEPGRLSNVDPSRLLGTKVGNLKLARPCNWRFQTGSYELEQVPLYSSAHVKRLRLRVTLVYLSVSATASELRIAPCCPADIPVQ